VIFATLFMSGGKALAAHENLTGAAYAAFLRGAAEGVMARGKAKAGDKTMVDALLPAADAAEGASTITEAAQAALRGGIEGREASKAMIAQFGRAKSLGEGAIGFPDAGACSVVIILETLAQHAQG
jgi:dihydroxyacetone kinase-like protein